jgi:serine/threonine-protein kinase
MTGPLVLPEDIQIVPLAEMPDDLRAQISGEGHDYAITRPHSRAPSKIIDAQAVELLRQFQKPTTLVEAIRRFSHAAQRHPAQVLEDVYPFLESCLIAKLLVEPGTDSETIRASFDKGALVANCQIRHCIQVLDDTELYRVRAGELEAALKIARRGSGQHVKQSLDREARILKRLNGRLAPQLLSYGETEDGRTYLVTDWISGELCGEAAAALRAGAQEPLPASLISLCAEILRAYAALHALGVVHSDVHTNNLLVTETGEVRIIDHGLSRVDGYEVENESVPRAGVGFFFEPEYAKAALAHSVPPWSSRPGEQYSVAALIYFLLSGQHYLDFSFAKEEVLRQIGEQPPVPLSARGLPLAGALDDVLLRALSKDPSARFPDMSAMAAAFLDAASHLPVSSQPARPSQTLAANSAPRAADPRLQHWLESTLHSLSDPALDLSTSGPRFPTASLTFGAAGVAYGLFRIASIREDASLFSLAQSWLDRAAREIRKGSGFYNPDVHVTPETVGCISPYHSPSGIACVQALLAHSVGDLQTRSAAVDCFLQFSDQSCENPDITVGRSSILLALSLLVDAFHWDKTADQGCLIEAGDKLLTGLWEQFDGMPRIGDPKVPAPLGMAHGWAGYLYATLRWLRSARRPAPSNLGTRLQELADQSLYRGARISWPCETGSDSPVLGGWCSGSAGFVFLWSLAHRLLRDPRWLALAEGAGRDACHPRDEGHSLCCGLAGKAYSQLCLYKHTGYQRWLKAASDMASTAALKTGIMKNARSQELPFSLYKGDIGVAVLVAELKRPDSSAMPFFEDEGWPTCGSARGTIAL